MENDSLVDRENDTGGRNINTRNDFFNNLIDEILLNTKIIKTILLIFLVFLLFFLAESNSFTYENYNSLDNKSFHISEILENFYDSVELFFYKTKPRTKVDYLHSYKLIKEHFEKNEVLSHYINMTYFFDEFYFWDLAEISDEFNKNITKNILDYNTVLDDITYAMKTNNSEINGNTNKNNFNYLTDKNLNYNNISVKKILNETINKIDNGEITQENMNFLNDKNTKKKDINLNSDILNKNKKVNKIKSNNTIEEKNRNEIIKKQIYTSKFKNFNMKNGKNSKYKSQVKIQLIKNLIELQKRCELSLYSLIDNKFECNLTQKYQENSTKTLNFNNEKNQQYQDITNDILISSYLSYYNRKYESYNSVENLFSALKKNFKNDAKDYNQNLINLLNSYEKKNYDKDDEFYYNYNKQINKKFLYFFYLMNNITSYDYKGKWLGSSKSIFFANNQGKIDLEIKKNFRQLRNGNIGNNDNSDDNSLIDFFDYFRNLEFSFYAIDGEYKNNWMIFNFTVNIPENFMDFVDFSDSANNLITVRNENTQIKFFIGEFLETKKKFVCDNTTLILEFMNTDFNEEAENSIILGNDLDLKFSRLNGKILNEECGIDLEFKLSVNLIDNFSYKVRSYSFIIILIALFQIYHTYNLITAVSENYQLGKNICLVTITTNMIWNGCICSTHFFLSLTQDDYIYEYGLISLSYFLLFSIFEIRLLYLSWKARNYELFYTDINSFRTKLFKFYCLIYFLLFAVLVSLRHIFVNASLSYFYFACTWLFQIIHNVIKNSKPPMKFQFILIFSTGKIFPMLYSKGYAYNIFELKPNYIFVVAIISTMMIHIFILELQKFIGGNFLLPKFLRKKPYNYYTNFDTFTNNGNSECIICLELLNRQFNQNILLGDNDRKERDKEKDREEDLMSYICSIFNYIVFIYNKIKRMIIGYLMSLKYKYPRKLLMRTPCNHVFHSSCLEKWIDLKNECPYCRREIPHIE